jgi:hypothetical protein
VPAVSGSTSWFLASAPPPRPRAHVQVLVQFWSSFGPVFNFNLLKVRDGETRGEGAALMGG